MRCDTKGKGGKLSMDKNLILQTPSFKNSKTSIFNFWLKVTIVPTFKRFNGFAIISQSVKFNLF